MRIRLPLLAAVLISATVLIPGCTPYPRDEALKQFKDQNPEVVVLDCFPGERDANNVYYHFRYTRGGEKDTIEQVWLFHRERDQPWEVTHSYIVPRESRAK